MGSLVPLNVPSFTQIEEANLYVHRNVNLLSPEATMGCEYVALTTGIGQSVLTYEFIMKLCVSNIYGKYMYLYT